MMDSIPVGKRIIVWRKHYLNVRRKRGFRTICEVLREVYLDAEVRGDPVTMTRMDEAADMAKRMQTRLEHYAGSHHALIHYDDAMVWVDKTQLLKLTPEELQMIYDHRAKSVEAA
jgi:hypothetical protein